MNTPVVSFIDGYLRRDPARLHMPGHKGCSGKEDITEIAGLNELYDAEGVLRESEKNASVLFGSRLTVYSAEGSSQCVKAMVYLCAQRGIRSILAARNAHRSFVHGAALCGMRVNWLYPTEKDGPYSCLISPEVLRETLRGSSPLPGALYVTSPDYLGREQDLKGLSKVCREYGMLLLCDNAHGAYLRFLSPSRHPMDLGADLCCDSAHKTLPVLTGGAYLHVGSSFPDPDAARIKAALELFGSSSPSWLILRSLDACNPYLASSFPQELSRACEAVQKEKARLMQAGWAVLPSDELRVVLSVPESTTGTALCSVLREHNVEIEFADRDVLVAMYTPQNREEDFSALSRALGSAFGAPRRPRPFLHRPRAVLPLQEAMLSPWEEIPVEKAESRICALPPNACPPAVSPLMPGERTDRETIDCLKSRGIGTLRVIRT